MHETISPEALMGLGDASARLSSAEPQMVHRVDISPIYPPAKSGLRHHVHYQGQLLVASARVPMFDAARALLSKGLTGRLEAWSQGDTSPRMTIDIEKAAKLTVRENERQGPVVVPYKPWPGADADRLPS